MVNKIIDLMRKNCLSKIKLNTLLDLGNELDDNLDEIPIVANTLEIWNGILCCYDDNDVDEHDRVYPSYMVKDLDEYEQLDLYFALKKTLNINN